MSKTNTTRRDLLAIMGITGATALVNTEACAAPANEGMPNGTPNLVHAHEKLQHGIANALEGLARGIRSGEIAARALDTSSRMDVDNWLTHDVHITVEMLGPQDTTS